jgi:hypothetical protein
MSGRVRWRRDGQTVTGYRKTDRRRGPPVPVRDKLDEINRKPFVARPAGALPEVRMSFLLPKSLQGFVATGKHGIGVTVMAKGFVQVVNNSSEQCFNAARDFFAVVAKDRPGFVAIASIISSKEPDRTYGRWLVVVKGALVECGGLTEPRIYEAV